MSKAKEFLNLVEVNVFTSIPKESGEKLQEYASSLMKQAKNLDSLGRAWAKLKIEDTTKLVRNDGLTKLELRKVNNTLRELNAEFGE